MNMLNIINPCTKISGSITASAVGLSRSSYSWSSLSRADVESILERDPRKFPWGIYTQETFIEGCSVFCWFESPAEILDYIAMAGPHFFCGGPHDDVEGATARLIRWRDRLLSSKRMLKSSIQSMFHSEFKDYEAFLWIGRFDELCKGKGEFANNFLFNYLEVEDESEDQKLAVPMDQIDDFIQYVATHGF